MNARNTNLAPPTPSVQTCQAATSANAIMALENRKINTQLLIVSVETARKIPSVKKNQSERSYLPQDYLVIKKKFILLI